MFIRCYPLILLSALAACLAIATEPEAEQAEAPTVSNVSKREIPPYEPPKGYVCYRATKPIRIDGKLDDPAWRDAVWTDDFVDIEGGKKPRPRFRTRVK